MSDSHGQPTTNKKTPWGAIFLVVSIFLLAAYVAGVPSLFVWQCSGALKADQISPGHIYISGQQTEHRSTSSGHGGASKAPGANTTPIDRQVTETAQATYLPARDSELVWWKRPLCGATLSDFLLGLFTLILAISTVGLWLVTEKTLGHARADSERQAKQMGESIAAAQQAADAAVVAQRPWIKIVDFQVADEMKEDTSGIRVGFKAKLKNVGNSPATNLQPWVALACGNLAYEVAFAKIPRWEGHGFSLFPDEDAPIERDLYGRLTIEEVDQAVAEEAALRNIRHTRQIGVVAVVSVTYDFVGGSGRTTKAYWLYGPDYRGGLLIQVDFDKLPISEDRLGLMRLSIHDTAD